MSLSRTYRPQTFADVTDQESIKETLRLEIATGKLGNAYLFAGPRGVGKTTLARVFAKALNCSAAIEGEPCNACAACVEFNTGKCIDYIEMDAASNTGVDNIREAIVEHVRFAPSGHAFKIYSLDEAHMLSTSAWNALLKTIEEPPAYAKFIFITTELHKVPATIQSRCQRFDFARVPLAALEERVRTLAKREGITIDGAVVSTIAAKADGCVRDAETFLGQMLSLGATHISSDIANLVLPISRLPIAAELLSVWGTRNLGESLEKIRTIEDQGIPLLSLFDDTIEAVRHLLLAADSVSWRQRLANGDEGERALAKLVGTFEPTELTHIALVLMERRRDAKQGADTRLCFELAAAAVALAVVGGQIAVSSGPLAVDRAQTTDAAKEPSTETVHAPPPTTHSSTSTVSTIQRQWPAFLRTLDESSKALVFIMKLAHPYTLQGDRLTIEFQYTFHKDKALLDLKSKRLIEESLRTVTGIPTLTIEGIIGTERAADAAPAPRDTVSSLLKTFGGQIVEEPGTV